MSYYQFRLQAGEPMQAPISGKLILVDDVDGAAGVDITPMRNNSTLRTLPKRKKAFKVWIDYDAVVLRADSACTVSIFLSFTDVSLGFADGALVNVAGGISVLNGLDERVPVDLAGGTVEVTASNVGISNTDANAVPMRQRDGDAWKVDQKADSVFITQEKVLSNLIDLAAVPVGLARVQVLNDATLKRARFRNTHATAAIALGGASVTLADAAVVLQPGDIWNEADAPGAIWHAISDTAGVSLAIMGVK